MWTPRGLIINGKEFKIADSGGTHITDCNGAMFLLARLLEEYAAGNFDVGPFSEVYVASIESSITSLVQRGNLV